MTGAASSRAREQLFKEIGERKANIRRRLLRWAGKTHRCFPWREPGLSAYEILIAEVLLRRTTATAAAKVYGAFLKRFPSFTALRSASAKDLEKVLASVGLQKQRAKAIKEMAAFTLEHWEGRLPEDYESLVSIPHVGPYAASAVRSFAFGQRAAIVDSNVERIFSRLFHDLLPERPKLTVMQAVADELLPLKRHKDFNLGLLDLGALVCRYQNPACGECPLAKVCDYVADTSKRRGRRPTS